MIEGLEFFASLNLLLIVADARGPLIEILSLYFYDHNTNIQPESMHIAHVCTYS